MLNSTNQFMGFDGFIWFQGVVESRKDPLLLGRVQVRILGLHTEKKNQIPTEDLPWAFPIMPITSASMNGIGQTPVGPVEGTWVVGFFRDGENCQEPMIFGTLGGIPASAANPSEGFNDPYAFYPKSDYVNEPDTNRLARNQKIDSTIVQKKKEAQVLTSIPVALETYQERESGDDTSWVEPDPAYNAKYPFNQVLQTQSGHVKEYDDTQGNTRIQEYHQLGTFYEVYEKDGKAHKLTKINGTNYTIVVDDDNLYVQGSINITTDARCNIYAGNDINIEAQSDCNIVTFGNTLIDTKGSINVQAIGDINLTAGGNLNINAGNITASSAGNMLMSSTTGSIFSSVAGMSLISQTNIAVSSNTGTVLSSVGPVTITSDIKTTVSGLSLILSSTIYTSVASDITLNIGTGIGPLTVKSPTKIAMLSPLVGRGGRLTFDPSI